MLNSEHPDVFLYRKNPEGFVQELYSKLKAAYSSLYSDHIDDVVKALKRLDEALHQGYSSEILLHKALQASAATEMQYRTSAAKFIKDFYWLRTYQKAVVINVVTASKPYQGPMPKRP